MYLWKNYNDVKIMECDNRCGIIAPKVISCVYVIIQISTGKLYIGQTIDFHRRYKDYATANNNINRNIKEAIRKNGWSDFVMMPLEICDIGELLYKEGEWISHYDVEYDNFHFNLPTNGTYPIKCREKECIYYNGHCEIGEMKIFDRNNRVRKMCYGGFRSQIG